MANNIYLRLPSYVAAFYRGLDEEHVLSEWEPYVFADYTHEATILTHSLRMIPEENQSTLCFGQRAWNNLLHGRLPQGGRQITRRDAQDWPSVNEVCALCNKPLTQKQETMEYLCIQIPREVVMSNRVYVTNGSYTLSYDVAQDLAKMMRTEFKHELLDWIVQDQRWCAKNGIHRTRLETIERFLTQYSVPVSVDRKERESLRRQVNRWLKDAHLRPNDRLDFETNFLEHISQEEIERTERNTRQARRKKG